jgi:hypothetical protein
MEEKKNVKIKKIKIKSNKAPGLKEISSSKLNIIEPSHNVNGGSRKMLADQSNVDKDKLLDTS